MAKPIAILYIPETFRVSRGGKEANAAMELMELLNDGYGSPKADRTTRGFWNDYYWFVFSDPQIDAPRLEVFHEKDFTEIQFNELKELVLAKINGPDKH